MSDPSDIDYTTPAQLPEGDAALERVGWHARMARAAYAELDELEAVYQAERARIEDRWDNRARIIQQRIDWHLAPIESWQRAHPHRKTLELPHGTARLRAAKQPRVFVADSDAVTEWARSAHPEILRAPNVTDIRKVVEVVGDDLTVIDPATGEVVPGVEAHTPEPTWSFDPDPGSPW